MTAPILNITGKNLELNAQYPEYQNPISPNANGRNIVPIKEDKDKKISEMSGRIQYFLKRVKDLEEHNIYLEKLIGKSKDDQTDLKTGKDEAENIRIFNESELEKNKKEISGNREEIENLKFELTKEKAAFELLKEQNEKLLADKDIIISRKTDQIQSTTSFAVEQIQLNEEAALKRKQELKAQMVHFIVKERENLNYKTKKEETLFAVGTISSGIAITSAFTPLIGIPFWLLQL